MKFDILGKMTYDPASRQLTLIVRQQELAADLIKEQASAAHPYQMDIKQKAPKRDEAASKYSWVLIDQIAKHDHISPAEAYMQYLRTNPAEDVRGVHSIQVKYANVWERGCAKYCKGVLQTDHIYYEPLGESELDTAEGKKPFRHYRIYLGQSHFNTHQMWQFIRGIEEDAKEYGIETIEEYKLKLMLDDWEKAYNKRMEKEKL